MIMKSRHLERKLTLDILQGNLLETLRGLLEKEILIFVYSDFYANLFNTFFKKFWETANFV